MFTAPLAFAHTYYLPHREEVVGAAAPELANLLHQVWTSYWAFEGDDWSDGVSAWLDPEGCVWIVVVKGRVVYLVTDTAALRLAWRDLGEREARAAIPRYDRREAHG